MPTATTDATSVLATPFALPGGARIKNRLVKASMSEQRANVTGAPTEALEVLYAPWARGGAGKLITGNGMIPPPPIGDPRKVLGADEPVGAPHPRGAPAPAACSSA